MIDTASNLGLFRSQKSLQEQRSTDGTLQVEPKVMDAYGCLWFHRFTIDLYSFKQIYIDVYRSIMIYMDLLLSHTSLHVVGQHDVAVVMEVSRFWAFDSWKADLVRRRRSRSRCDVMTWLGGFELLIWVCHGMSENGSTWGIPWYTHQLEGCDVIFY